MTADASQASLPLGVFFALAGVAAFGVLVYLLIEGESEWRRFRREFERDDRLDVYGSDDEPTACTDPACGCEQAREVARANLREFQRSQWVESLRAVARADAEAVQR